MEHFRGCRPAEDFAWPVVDLVNDLVEFFLGEVMEAGSLREVLAEAPVEVFIGATLIRAVRVSEIGGHPNRVCQPVMVRELSPCVWSNVCEPLLHSEVSRWFQTVVATLY
ncbi:MAG TPA: hypothetical protein VLZ31_01100 [Microbacteriaceae bacterium]|nr:hypothetical protein [Microbacteriaceae bacterium]